MSACDSCAFGTGGAAKEAMNRLKSDICAFGAIPFFCHHGKDGTEYDWKESPLGPLVLRPENRKLCSGWRAKVAELKRRGYFPSRDFTLIRRIVAQRALGSLVTFTAKDISLHKKERARKALTECMKFIVKKDNGEMGIPL